MHGLFSSNTYIIKPNISGQSSQKGAVMVLFAVCLIVLIGVVGLAIDTSMAYLAKARLSLAADSAVLAAADVYEKDTDKEIDPATRGQHAREASNAYFIANYPHGFLGTINTVPQLEIKEDAEGAYLKYGAYTNNPLTLAKVLPSATVLQPTTLPVVTLKNIKGNVDVVVLMDASTSITKPTWDMMVNALLTKYLSHLDKNTTRIAVIPFSSEDLTKVTLSFCPNDKCPAQAGFEPDEVRKALSEYTSGETATFRAFRLAVQEFENLEKKIPQSGVQKVIVLMTDGYPTDSSKEVVEDYVRTVIHEQENIEMSVIPWNEMVSLSSSEIESLKCIAGDRENPASVCNSSDGQFKAFDGSTFCLADDDASLDHCLVKTNMGERTSVLIE